MVAAAPELPGRQKLDLGWLIVFTKVVYEILPPVIFLFWGILCFKCIKIPMRK